MTPPTSARATDTGERQRTQPDASSPDAPAPIEAWLCVVWLGVVLVWLTWAPFGARAEPATVRVALPRSPIDIVGNFFLLVPLASAFVLLAPRRGVAAAAFGTALAAVGVSLAIEAGQWSIANRVVSPWDVALNVGGAAAAGAFVARLRWRGLAPRRAALALVGAVWLLAGALAGHAALVARDGLTLADWRSDYPLLAGDEAGGGRAYIGEIREPLVCAAVALEPCAVPGASDEERAALAAAAERSQTVVLSASVVSHSAAQDGPARIVTFSESPDRRNATLAQEGSALVLRVRTPVTGENGSQLEFVLPDAVPVGKPAAVRGEFERGRAYLVSVTADGTASATFALGLLDAWILFSPVERLDPATLRLARLVGALVLLLPALAIAALARWRVAPA